MEKINGITILYADDLRPYLNLNYILEAMAHWDYIETETAFFKKPQSERIRWVEDLCQAQNGSEQKIAVITNDYHFIRMIEFNMIPEKYQIHNLDKNTTVSKFVDIKPNPTLKNGEYIFRASAWAGLKRKKILKAKEENPQL